LDPIDWIQILLVPDGERERERFIMVI
jgi:hypothetical protein